MKVHENLKVLQPYFNDVKSGRKTFELRYNDRDYQTGDVLNLCEWSLETGYTGEEINKTISYVLEGGIFGLQVDHCILGLEPVEEVIEINYQDYEDLSDLDAERIVLYRCPNCNFNIYMERYTKGCNFCPGCAGEVRLT